MPSVSWLPAADGGALGGQQLAGRHAQRVQVAREAPLLLPEADHVVALGGPEPRSVRVQLLAQLSVHGLRRALARVHHASGKAQVAIEAHHRLRSTHRLTYTLATHIP